jgi:quinolinate synthase
MAMNGLANLAETLETGTNEIHVDPEIARLAYAPIERMLAFSARRNVDVRASGDLARDGALFRDVGPA